MRRRGMRAGRGGARLVAVALLVAGLATGCGPAPTPSVAPSPTASPVATAAAAPTYADTLRIGFVRGRAEAVFLSLWVVPAGFRQASVGAYPYYISPSRAVNSALYRFDAGYDVVPELADGPCEPRGDGTVIRCALVETTFHDGTPVTADDVAFAYRVAQRWGSDPWPLPGTGSLREVRIVDDRTVDFVLSAVDPTFLTTVLPAVPILPRHAIEASYAAFVAGTSELTSTGLTELANTIDEELGRYPPVCGARVEEVAALLERIGVTLYHEDFVGATGEFDPCSYLPVASRFIRQAAVALDATGLDAVAAAWQLLALEWRPVGAGPYRLVSEDADRIHLEAWPGYHGGPAATRFIDFVPTNPDGSDLVAGSVDIFQWTGLGAAFQATAGSRDILVAAPTVPGFMALIFNVRPGSLFAERDLRLALQLCIDLARDVDAVTGGHGTPVYGPALPGSWADEPDLPRPDRDPPAARQAAARQLIEGAGWTRGADGIYARDGVPLAADILAPGR